MNRPGADRRRRARRGALAATLAVLAALLGAAPTPAAEPVRARSAVVGGVAAPPGAYPWIVALNVGCGGTLVAPDRVLTAAHCVRDQRVSGLRVYVGARLRSRGALRYDGRSAVVADIALHPDYGSLAGGAPVNDVALVQLAEPVPGVAPVPLATAETEGALTRAGARATVVGWGATGSSVDTGRLARRLRQGALRVLSDRSCGRIYGTARERGGVLRPQVMVCARSADRRRRPATSPCSGDSGGPLVARGVQVGVVSFGIACGALREPTVFARVAGLRAFIDDPAPTFIPQPLGRPAIEGTAAPGGTVTCRPPAFRNDVTRLGTRWGIDGRLVAYGESFRVPRSAAGRTLACRVVASNAGGRVATGRSPELRVAG